MSGTEDNGSSPDVRVNGWTCGRWRRGPGGRRCRIQGRAAYLPPYRWRHAHDVQEARALCHHLQGHLA
eukprot:1152424-Amphidinium_carterae.1